MAKSITAPSAARLSQFARCCTREAIFLGDVFFGILVADFAVTLFFATLSEGWSDGLWERLWDWKSLVFLALFVGSFIIPKVVRKFRPEACNQVHLQGQDADERATGTLPSPSSMDTS